MSEDETRVAEEEDVEAHRRSNLAGHEEPGDEARKEDEDDDDFEAHRRSNIV